MTKLYIPNIDDKPLKTEASEKVEGNEMWQSFQPTTVGGINTQQIPALFDPVSRTCVPVPKK